jgi:hypothetical protein
MICLKRNKKKFYLCKKIPNSTKFDKPILCNLNYNPTNSTGEIISFGQDYSMYLRIKCSLKEATQFKNGDKCYIYVIPPEEYDPLCKDADYIVDGSPLNTINQSEIILRKLSGNNE